MLSHELAVFDLPKNQGPEPVGSAPMGRGRWKSLDLAGNVIEWVRDAACAATDACSDVVDVQQAVTQYVDAAENPLALAGDGDEAADVKDVSARGGSTRHVLRGGSFKNSAPTEVYNLRTAYREMRLPNLRENDTGVRCARSAPER
jgi:formylglycine-generating enzyme required for sulfatase activity